MLFVFHQEEREQLNEFKTLATGLNKRAKSIIQLKPRNPTSSIKGKLPIQAVCDFKQQEVSDLGFIHSPEWSYASHNLSISSVNVCIYQIVDCVSDHCP